MKIVLRSVTNCGLPQSRKRTPAGSGGKVEVAEELTLGQQIRNAGAVAEGLARRGRVVEELFADHLAEELVMRQGPG